MFRLKKAALLGTEQGVYAVTQLIFNIIVARVLDIESFGYFTMLLSITALMSALVQPMLIEAMIVKSSKNSSTAIQNSYFSFSIISYFLVSCLVLILSLILYWVLKLPHAFVYLCISEIFLSLFLFARRMLYAERKELHSLFFTVLYLATSLIGLLYLNLVNSISLDNIALVRLLMGVIPICLFLMCNGNTVFLLKFSRYKKLFNPIFKYAKPMVMGAGIFWITNSSQVFLVGAIGSVELAAALRVGLLFVLPMNIFLTAVFQAFMAKYVGFASTKIFRRKIHAIMFVVSIIYALFILTFSSELVLLIFGSSYQVYSWIVNIVVLGCIIDAFKQILVLEAYRLELTNLFFKFRLYCLACFIVINIPVLIYLDFGYFVSSIVQVNALTVVTLFISLRKKYVN